MLHEHVGTQRRIPLCGLLALGLAAKPATTHTTTHTTTPPPPSTPPSTTM